MVGIISNPLISAIAGRDNIGLREPELLPVPQINLPLNNRDFPQDIIDISQQVRQSDAQINSDIQRAIASAGSNATVNVQFSYGITEDGQLFIKAATITESERVNPEDISALFGTPTSNSATNNSINQEDNGGVGLSPSERDEVRRLQAADSSVRSHEAQHFRAAGGLAIGSPNFTFQIGPDGRHYAVGGSVDIKTTTTNNPDRIASDAATLINAASAPSDASAQDISVARSASQNLYQNSREDGDRPVLDLIA